MQEVKVIRRYANRKLYDTSKSKYTTLKEIVGFIVAGQAVQVVDNVSNEDITAPTLLSAIVETTDTPLDSTTLVDILRAGGLGKYVAGIKAKGVSDGIQ